MRRGSKYRNIKTVVDGVTFHSKKEAARYEVLRDLMSSGVIENLRLQVSHQITVNGFKICRYISDFEYFYNGEAIVEDVKGRRTPVYALKAKLMKACLGIDILET